MGKKSGPKPPDPVETAEAQARLNKEAVYESARVNQINQFGPWGSSVWYGDIGQPNRRQMTTLDPADQQALDLRRNIYSGLLGVGLKSILPQLAYNFSGGQYTAPPGVAEYTSRGVAPSIEEIANRPPYPELDLFPPKPEPEPVPPGRPNPPFSPGPPVGGPGVGSSSLGNAQNQRGQPSFAAFRHDEQGNLVDMNGRPVVPRERDGRPPGAERPYMPGPRKPHPPSQPPGIESVPVSGSESMTPVSPPPGLLDFSGLPRISGQYNLARAAAPLEAATFQRGRNLLGPDFERQQSQLANTLAQRGIPLTAEAYTGAQDRLDRSQNEALENLALSSVGAGRAEQSRLFGLQQAARNQALNEMLTKRTQPINELSALLQGAPAVGQPQFPSFAQYGMQSPDYMGMVQNNYAIRAQAAQRARSDMFGGVFGLGKALIGAIPFSDRRLKRDIKKVGRLDNGLPVYAFRYLNDEVTRLGVMADEVERVRPEAVHQAGAFKAVDYDKAVL